MSAVAMGSRLKRAAKHLMNADAIVFSNGAGLGVDSGLPDFRGNEGFWRAYPPIKHLGLRFEEMSTPKWFDVDPEFAWGFWFHRLSIYRDAKPHYGYEVMKNLADSVEEKQGHFVFTSNVDGAFRKAGFSPDRLLEVHGTTDYLQCTKNCSDESWSSADVPLIFDKKTFRTTREHLPRCPKCKAIARPQVLMFGDWTWNPSHYEKQEREFELFKRQCKRNCKLVVVEIGAGHYVPTVRMQSESLCRTFRNSVLVRINPRDTDVPREKDIALPLGGLEALTDLEKLLLGKKEEKEEAKAEKKE